jgi:hypothetical protein
MKPPRAYARGIVNFFGGIRRSTLLAYSAEAAASAAKAGRSASFGLRRPKSATADEGRRVRPLAFIHGLTAVVFCEGG